MAMQLMNRVGGATGETEYWRTALAEVTCEWSAAEPAFGHPAVLMGDEDEDDFDDDGEGFEDDEEYDGDEEFEEDDEDFLEDDDDEDEEGAGKDDDEEEDEDF